MNTGYIHVEIALGNYVHGDGKLGTVPLQPDGQWDAFLPATHQQNENGFEPSDCVTEATVNCVEALQIKEYGVSTDWARRFLAKNSGTDVQNGNDPQTVSECLRTKGCVYTPDYPFSAPDFNTFYQPLPKSLTTLGIGEFAQYAYGHSWVSGDQQSMIDALPYSPLSAAGFAWQIDPNTGYYITPPNATPEHDFVVYGYVRNMYWKVRDSYAPFEKKLAWDFKFTGVKRHTINRQTGNTPDQQTAWQKFLQFLYTALGFQGPSFGAARSSGWAQVQKAFLSSHPTCAVCGKKGGIVNPLNVHHCESFSRCPQRELDPTNLITLCRQHHFLFGHLLNWASENVSVREDSALWYEKIANRPSHTSYPV